MTTEQRLIAFGPVPSRRLGQSVGVNNIPPKICSYSCVYCQLGRSLRMQLEREAFYDPQWVFEQVEKKVAEAVQCGEAIDYITVVSDGEPTLELHLGQELELMKRLDRKLAVITNASLIWDPDVREALCKADWVSVKVDAVSHDVWRQIDRPHGRIDLDKLAQGRVDFSKRFTGELNTETMLVQGVNDTPEELHLIARHLESLSPTTCYLSIPTRPPAETWVHPPAEEAISRAYHIFREHALNVEYLIGYEGNAFAWTGNVEEDLLSITSVHPMREDAVQEFVTKASARWDVIEKLLEEKKLIKLSYQENTFYMRALKR